MNEFDHGWFAQMGEYVRSFVGDASFERRLKMSVDHYCDSGLGALTRRQAEQKLREMAVQRSQL